MILMKAEGIYAGVQTGQSKNGKPWFMLNFKVTETYKGTVITPQSLFKANMIVFCPDNFSPNQFTNGKSYHLHLGVSARMNNGRAFPNFELVSVDELQPIDQTTQALEAELNDELAQYTH